MRLSKNFYYEKPCSVTGTGNCTGSEGHLRTDDKIRGIGTWKGWNMELITGFEVLGWKVLLHITILYPIERDGMVPVKQQ